MKKLLKIRRLIPALLFGLVIVAAVCIHSLSKGAGFAQALCDGFFIAGVMIFGSGCLAFANKQGMFDIFAYGISHVFTTRWPGLSSMSEDRRKEKYVDYKIRKQQERKSPVGLLLAGGVYLLLAGVMLVIYLAAG